MRSGQLGAWGGQLGEGGDNLKQFIKPAMNLARFIEQVCKPADWPGSRAASKLVGQDAKQASIRSANVKSSQTASQINGLQPKNLKGVFF